MKKIVVIVMALVLSLTLVACGGETTDSSKSNKAETVEKEEQKEKVYGIGDTWTVDGQWSLTINSITPTDERNEFDNTNPEEVVIIEYAYKNIGYEDPMGIMNGLYLNLAAAQVIDADGQMCRSYPAMNITKFAQETPIGATCVVQEAFGLTKAGAVEIIMSQFDSDLNDQIAKFRLEY